MTDRPISAYERASQTFRDRMLAIDATALDAVTDAYRPIAADLAKQIELLEKELLDKSIDSPSKLYKLKRYQTLLTQIDEQMGGFVQDVGTVILDGQQTLTGIAQDEVQTLAEVQAGETSRVLAQKVAGQFTRLNTGAFNSLVGSLADGSPLGDYLAALPDKFGAIIKDELLRGIALGQHPRLIADNLNQKLYGGVARLLTSTRSIMLDSYRSASLATMAENSDILAGWQWQSAHDPRTCGACLALDDGSIHPVTETFMGSHPGCRCNPRPVVEGSTPSKRQTGGDYFDGLKPDEQDGILGKGGGKAYRDGKVTLNDFIHLDKDDRWGDRYRQGSLRDALSGKSTTRTSRGGDGGSSGSAEFDSDQDATQWREQTYSDWSKNYTKGELDAVADYRASGYHEINELLRNGPDAARKFLEEDGESPASIDAILKGIPGQVKRLDSSMAKTTTERDLVVWRGANGARFGDLSRLKGSLITDDGYTSSTIRKDVRDKFISYIEDPDAVPASIRILVPKGSNVIPVDAISGNQWEEEFLLPRGSRFRVVDVVERSGQPPEITLELQS